jgi:hypothetical protein
MVRRFQSTTSSQRAARESRLWVDTRMLAPPAASARSSAVMVASERRSTPANGSSSSSVVAPWAMARAINTRLRCPPDSSPIWRDAVSASSTRASASATAVRSMARTRRVNPWLPYRPIITTSYTLTGKSQSTPSFCGIYASTPARRAAVGGIPLTRTEPDSGVSSPRMHLNRVDLPDPLTPTRPVMRLWPTAMLALSSAITSPKRTVTPSTSIAGTTAVMPVCGRLLIGRTAQSGDDGLCVVPQEVEVGGHRAVHG